MKWIVKNDNNDIIEDIKEESLLENLLTSRGINVEDKEYFINGMEFDDPFKFPDMKKVVDRIILARDKKEKIIIHGDYDVDGVTASSILFLYFKKVLGIEDVQVHIPNRFEEGYGISEVTIDNCIENNVNLIITVDCGIKDKKLIEKAMKAGIDVIVTDHHSFEELPPAFAILHPKFYTYNLCGAGVAFKLAQALDTILEVNFSETLVDLAGLGTVCDVMELKGENRVIVKHALRLLRDNTRIGLKKMFDYAGVDPLTLEIYHIGFVIGPRLNASGRLTTAESSLNLLITEDTKEAHSLALTLNDINKRRQDEMKLAIDMALTLIEKDKYINILFIPNISIGVIGLVASRVTEYTGFPSIILTEDAGNIEPDILSGSCRSIDNLNIVDALNANSKYFVKFGGHAKAAGLKLKRSDFEIMKKSMEKYAEKVLKGKDNERKLYIDMVLSLDNLDLVGIYNSIALLEPFGEANPKPVFLSWNVLVNAVYYLGENGKHLKLLIGGIEALAFNKGEFPVKKGQRVDIVYNIAKNVWNGNEKFQLHIIDIKSA